MCRWTQVHYWLELGELSPDKEEEATLTPVVLKWHRNYSHSIQGSESCNCENVTYRYGTVLVSLTSLFLLLSFPLLCDGRKTRRCFTNIEFKKKKKDADRFIAGNCYFPNYWSIFSDIDQNLSPVMCSQLHIERWTHRQLQQLRNATPSTRWLSPVQYALLKPPSESS